jgi:5-methylcytosine-specific restriction enzyme subunit McrC
MKPTPKVISLREYQSISLLENDLPVDLGNVLYQQYSRQIDLEFPSPKTNYHWQLNNQGWVGHIPVADSLHLALTPKTSIHNLFRMLEYAYRLQSFKLLDGTIESKTLTELYERLANILAKRILDRARKGYYRAYISEEGRLPFVRGRLDLHHALTKQWEVALTCHYQEHTADIEDNQLLTWTLFRIARNSAVRSEKVRATVRRAYRSLQNLTTLTPFQPQACANRLYHRLNQDYHPLHALARFFLEQQGPSHQLGDRTMIPFVIDMARLYELFVAEWLRLNLPETLILKTQHQFLIDEANNLQFIIDLLIEDAVTGEIRYVLDTKYKVPDRASTTDIQQVGFYAHDRKAREAILVYPVALLIPLQGQSQGVRLRSLTFALDGDLEQAGKKFLADLLA